VTRNHMGSPAQVRVLLVSSYHFCVFGLCVEGRALFFLLCGLGERRWRHADWCEFWGPGFWWTKVNYDVAWPPCRLRGLFAGQVETSLLKGQGIKLNSPHHRLSPKLCKI
jgi:hypothetical protein